MDDEPPFRITHWRTAYTATGKLAMWLVTFCYVVRWAALALVAIKSPEIVEHFIQIASR